jgi:hypothetical protein
VAEDKAYFVVMVVCLDSSFAIENSLKVMEVLVVVVVLILLLLDMMVVLQKLCSTFWASFYAH